MTSCEVLKSAVAEPRPCWNAERPWRPTSLARVLIVEDDADLRRGLGLWLRHQGFDVTAVGDGAAGLGAVEQHEPDILLLDLGLPRMHGFKVLHQLRHRSVAAPRTIVLTAAGGEGIRERALHSGADALLHKPVDNARLLQTIDDLLRS
ncbi:MAG: response regulator transcription factor [Planctomycetota bacterium]